MPYLTIFKVLKPHVMIRFCCLLATVLLLSCKTTTYYVVRHAEKEVNTMSSDVPLSAEGGARAEALREKLQGAGIREIYSTNFIRTKGTAQPLATALGLPIQTYAPGDTALINRLRQSASGAVLLVGHSNTVDDLVNRLGGSRLVPGDLPDTQYGDLFIVRKKGSKFHFEKQRFGR
jgi:2,3-bisphosphoglycerate-dependent phosphoglycerate mutase